MLKHKCNQLITKKESRFPYSLEQKIFGNKMITPNSPKKPNRNYIPSILVLIAMLGALGLAYIDPEQRHLFFRLAETTITVYLTGGKRK